MLRRDSNIIGHLRIFAMALALPILLMSGFIGWAYLSQEEKRIEDFAERQAVQVMSEINNRLEAYRAMLSVLSGSPRVLEGDMDYLRQRLERMETPPDIWFVVRERTGQQILNTALGSDEPLPSFPGRGDSVIFGDGKPFTSNLIWAQATKQWAVTLSVPVRVPAETGEVKYAMTIGIPATHLQQLLAGVSEGWVAAINDREGKILARSLAHDQWVGKPMSRSGYEVAKDVLPGQGGIWRDVYTLEGAKVIGAYHRMESTGWLIGVSALPDVYRAPFRNILLLGLTLAAITMLLATFLAFLMGRRITKAIQLLQVKASAMRDMRIIDFPRTSVEEVNVVAGIMRSTTLVLRERQEQQTTLIQELNHRVKNTLATIQAISRMTIKNSKSLNDFDEAFSARLMALSVTHNLLTESSWSGTKLHELLDTELKPFQVDRLSLSGPAVDLSSKIAVALGMAIHELGTNAAKYGAWHGGDGRIHVRWFVSEDRLTLDWRERCGRLIEQPTRQGFGSRLIQQTVVSELQGSMSMEFLEDGLHGVFVVPLSADDHLVEPSH